MLSEHPQFGRYVETLTPIPFDSESDSDIDSAEERALDRVRRVAEREGFRPYAPHLAGHRQIGTSMYAVTAVQFEDELSAFRFGDLPPELREHVLEGQPLPPAFVLNIATITSRYRDGDEHGWETEFALVRREFPEALAGLMASIQEDGQREPVLLGSDGRVWDGHKRLTALTDLGTGIVVVQYPDWA